MLADGISTLDTRSPQVVLEPNLTYWDPKRTPKVRIVYENAIPKEEAIKSVAAGDGWVDVVTDLTPAEAHAFQGGSVAAIHAQPAKTVLAGVFNENKPDSPWRSLEVRRALNMAIDRDAVVKRGVHGYGSVMPAFIQPGRYGAVSGMAAYKQDAAAAAAAIEKAGLKGREILLLASPDWTGVVEALTENLAKVGLTVRADYSKTEPEGWTSSWCGTSTGRRSIRSASFTASSSAAMAPTAPCRRTRRSTRCTPSCCAPRTSRRRKAWCGRSSSIFTTRPARCS